MQFSLPLRLRVSLWDSGFGGIDSAIRYAAIELDLYFLTHTASLSGAGDDGERHFANFYAWSDSALVGVNDSVREARDENISQAWLTLAQHPLRRLMREMRHKALKQRSEVIGWEYQQEIGDGGFLIEEVFQMPAAQQLGHTPILGTASDYLHWIRDEALVVLLRTVSLGVRGDDPRRSDEMPFANADPWSTRLEAEPRCLLEGLEADFGGTL